MVGAHDQVRDATTRAEDTAARLVQPIDESRDASSGTFRQFRADDSPETSTPPPGAYGAAEACAVASIDVLRSVDVPESKAFVESRLQAWVSPSVILVESKLWAEVIVTGVALYIFPAGRLITDNVRQDMLQTEFKVGFRERRSVSALVAMPPGLERDKVELVLSEYFRSGRHRDRLELFDELERPTRLSLADVTAVVRHNGTVMTVCSTYLDYPFRLATVYEASSLSEYLDSLGLSTSGPASGTPTPSSTSRTEYTTKWAFMLVAAAFVVLSVWAGMKPLYAILGGVGWLSFFHWMARRSH